MENPGYEGIDDIPHPEGGDDDDPTDPNPPRFPTGEGVEQVLEHLLCRKGINREIKSEFYQMNCKGKKYKLYMVF